ncbi:MAG: hypothetical protein ACRDV4_01090, partial [Acidimicrobiales bacterium]
MRRAASAASLVSALVVSVSVLLAVGTTAAARSGASSLNASRCSANRGAGTVTYVSPFGYDASAGILDVFAAQKLGY